MTSHCLPTRAEEVFCEACSDGNLALVNEFLDLKRPLDPNWAEPPTLKSGLYLAARHDHPRVVSRLLKDRRVMVNQTAADAATALFIAAQSGAEQAVRLLLLHPGIEVNSRTSRHDRTPLWQAAWMGHVPVVKELVRHPLVALNHRDNEGSTALWIAAQEGHLEVVKVLLAASRGLEIGCVWEANKKTAIEQAIQNGHVPVANLLLEYQQDPRQVRDRLRRELSTLEPDAAELFALLVMLADDYYRFQVSHYFTSRQEANIRFLSIGKRLPIELQMVLCRRVFGLSGVLNRSAETEKAFQKFAFIAELHRSHDKPHN